jgi:DNA-binding NarL/FixJ family response regulator
MDISLPKLSGIEAARQIRKVAPNCKILFLSTYDSLEIVEAALDSAASGYVLKVDAGKELAKAVKAVFQGKRYVSGRLKKVTPADTGDTHAPDREVLGSPSVPALLRKTESVRWVPVQTDTVSATPPSQESLESSDAQ